MAVMKAVLDSGWAIAFAFVWLFVIAMGWHRHLARLGGLVKKRIGGTVTVFFRFSLRRDVTADVKLSGRNITAKDLETLREFLNLARDTWEDAPQTNDEPVH